MNSGGITVAFPAVCYPHACACYTQPIRSHQERTEESANSSVPPGHDTEHQRATFEGGPAPSAQEAIESLLESSLNLQRDTQDDPDSTTSDSLLLVPQDSPDAHPDSEGEGEEAMVVERPTNALEGAKPHRSRLGRILRVPVHLLE
jgi:hypothetical protein